MTKLTWKFWMLLFAASAGAHLVFGSGWSQTPDKPRTCGCLIDLSQPAGAATPASCPVSPE